MPDTTKDTAYHLIDVPGLGQMRVPISYSPEDVLRDIAETDMQDAEADLKQKG